MKKIVRILGITLTLLVLASCDKDDDSNDPITDVTTSNLKGTYTYMAVSVKEGVDLNGDGVKNNDLKKEGYKTRTLDNNLEITDTNYSFIMKGEKCSDLEGNMTFTYKLDKNAKTITLFLNNSNAGEITNVNYYNFNGTKRYSYYVYDEDLKQDVAYVMTAI